MKIKDLIKNTSLIEVIGDPYNEVANLEIDSRLVKKDTLFAALKGTQSDGHEYIGQAIKQGAVAILCEEKPLQPQPGVTYLIAEHSENALGYIASTFYNTPSHKIQLVGVTGTNGKTTIATLLYNTFKRLGYKVGLLSTVCNYIDDKKLTTTHTTPDAITINSLLNQMVECGCQYAFMEVSSHAIDQKRIAGLRFAGGIFTNLTRDHLDYHKTVSNYIKAKKAFFDNLPAEAFSLINLDDKNGLVMVQNTKSHKYNYSLRSLADFKARVIELHFDGMLLEVNNTETALQFTGKFNAYNLLAVYGASILLGQKHENILIALSTLKSVSGRFETIKSPTGYTAIIDYAHTPNALTNVLTTIHEILDGNGKVITVVGAGGNRDKGKRPIMAKEAVKYSDKTIITSDNPRFEDPEEIIQDMMAGLSLQDKQNTVSIINRKDAIKTACMLAQPHDVILIAGKGHETYQDIKGVKHHFDDKEEVKLIFETLK